MNAAAWLTVEEVASLHERPRQRIQEWVTRGEVISRFEGQRRLILAASLPVELQRRLADQAGALLPPAPIDAPDLQRRLRLWAGRDELLAAFTAEAHRRAGLLDVYAGIEPKTVRGPSGARGPSAGVAAVLADWPARDPAILAERPSWGEVPTQRTLDRALAAYREHGPLALLPVPPAATEDDGRRAEVSDALRQTILHYRLDLFPAATVTALHRRLSAEFPGEMPSRSWLRAFLDRAIDPSQDVYERQGVKTWRGQMARPIRRRYDQIDVGEWICGDHHQFDIEVIDPAKKGGLSRPWLTAWFDLRSRAPMGWVLRCESPNTQAIAEAFTHAVMPKADPLFERLCGLPEVAYIDNGKDYRSRAFVEGMLALGGGAARVEDHNALPYNAKAKPVERWFRTVCDGFSKDQLTYLGNSPVARTERYEELRAQHAAWLAHKAPATPFITLDELKRRFAAWVVEYLQRPSDALTEIESGRQGTPAQIAAERRSQPRIPDELSLSLLGWPRWKRVTRKGEVKIDGQPYTSPALLPHDGATVECRRDPRDAGRLLVVAIEGPRKGQLLGEARAQLTGYVRHGDKIGQAELARVNRERRAEERTLAEARKIRLRRVLGEPAPAAAITPPAPEPSTPASTVSVLPEGAVHQLLPTSALARRLAKAPDAAAPAEECAPAVEPVTEEQRVAAYVEQSLGPRPERPRYFPHDLARQRWEREVADWDRLAAELAATQRTTRMEATTHVPSPEHHQ